MTDEQKKIVNMLRTVDGIFTDYTRKRNEQAAADLIEKLDFKLTSTEHKYLELKRLNQACVEGNFALTDKLEKLEVE